jgi:hypothetical protein
MVIEKGKWLTVNEAAELSGYHPEHVRRLIREGAVIARKFSIVWQVDRDSIRHYVNSQKVKAPKSKKS